MSNNCSKISCKFRKNLMKICSYLRRNALNWKCRKIWKITIHKMILQFLLLCKVYNNESIRNYG